MSFIFYSKEAFPLTEELLKAFVNAALIFRPLTWCDSVIFKLKLCMQQHLKTTRAAWRILPSFLGCSSLWSQLLRSSNRLCAENREDWILTSKEEQRKRGGFSSSQLPPGGKGTTAKALNKDSCCVGAAGESDQGLKSKSAVHVATKKEEQNIGAPNYISLPTSICSYHSSTRLCQLRQYLYINKGQSIEKLKRKVKVIRLKLLLMSFQ